MSYETEELVPTAELSALAEENAKLRAAVAAHDDTAESAAKYDRLVNRLIRGGLTRPQAVAQASRENPSGRRDFLLTTNRRSMAEDIRRASKMTKKARK
jgi:hypothetical protein